jgi:glutamate dehydrogenase/leucine dehydrogenase
MSGVLHTTVVHHYVDPVEGFRGFLAIDEAPGAAHRLAAGGLRVQLGLDEETLAGLARAMSLKERLLGLGVDGAKSGIDYDPRAPGKADALRRFLRFLRPFLLDRVSSGPDLGTTWPEIEAIARSEGIPSVKVAIARAQGLDEDDFMRRIRVLDTRVAGFTLAQRRAGHALAHAAMAGLEKGEGVPTGLRAGLQGFGNVGRGAAIALAEAGVALSAVADEYSCLTCDDGLDVQALLALPHGTPIGDCTLSRRTVGPPEALFEAPVDLIVLAACEDAVSPRQASSMPARAVAVGANLGLTPVVEALLNQRGVAVIPDFVAGCGGSASMDALFGPRSCPSAEEVLDHVAARMRSLVAEMFVRARRDGISPREAALALCEANAASSPAKPYGHWLRTEAGESSVDMVTGRGR